MKNLWLILVLGVACPILAEDAPERDRKAILAMAGSYEVDFHFEEFLGYDRDYQRHPDEDATALESVVVVSESPTKIILQHLLQTSQGIIKHWRQDWEYQNTRLLEYQGKDTWAWRAITAELAQGTWTQRVFQVDDSPRYESFGRWVHRGTLSEWRSELTYRPLPRRESKREDYDVLLARNTHALTPEGWVHIQDNMKYKLQNEKAIAREFGLNQYRLTRADRLAEARAWWTANAAFWKEVREQWQTLLSGTQSLKLQGKVDGKTLFARLSEMQEQHQDPKSLDIQKLLTLFVEPPAAHAASLP